MADFRGQSAIVTGATGGVGHAIASALVSAGAAVLLAARRGAALNQLIRESGWRTDSVSSSVVDLADESDVRTFAVDASARCPDLHLLIHAAGAIALGAIGDSRLNSFDEQYQINVRAPFQLTQVLLPNLIRGRGQVVFINSSAGLHARPGIAQYSATKHALRAVADSLRDEVNERGVRVLSVFLGRTASRMQQAVHEHEGRDYHPERLLQPSDVASIVLSALLLPRTAEVTDLHIRPMLKS
jgi:NADP-dependent 3-hydroxy acid dehydrogenase YdfG